MATSPRQRAQFSRGVQYAVLAVLLLVIVLTADWGTLKDQFFNGEILPQLFPTIFTTALKNTVLYTACAFVFGLLLGLGLALMRLSSVGPYRWLATTFIEFFRGVPALIVFIGFYYGLPVAFPGRVLPGGTLGVVTVALGLVGAAYMAETIRAGIQAVPKGQMEAARSLGMRHSRAMLSIVIPQAFRIILPPLTNELILLTKDSSLVYVIGLSLADSELTDFGRRNLSQFVNLTPLFAVALSYLIITVPLSIVVRRMEARAERAR
ncbi:amino acid ABC transporter permease [Phycicoccus endophyticus]|uniref:Amino acid ABC transporter permease n=1 Tax=Phycicoccus endophyticus TaxID=1690220 RepID=A0A7G9R4L9_9MICO|nr:amino acid ABC transporter permease [Phycicoccus endophyticus]NHI18441.1 amino acid ABC transporter permease [Phycicoccus endophyticus]QNN50544.1 amino acid ABC transporter permease [Phycicoccus endophyticus]GGL23753.1 amino acid ABC transporter permease [Phycicoccus endophyticus]